MDWNFDKLNRLLDGISNASSNGQKVKYLSKIMCNVELWQLAYANIYSNKGALTEGVDEETLDGMSAEKYDILIDLIRNDKYRPKPVRRSNIPKKDGGRRPLGVPSGGDKLVQTVIKILLEQIYEPVFLDTSHGFRPVKSCHTALQDIMTWQGMKWFVEFDIKGCFDNINHQILMKLLEKRIDDKRFLKLIWRFLKAGYMEDWEYHHTYNGTPQGGTISPILANIYLHELDELATKLTGEFNIGKRRPANPEYQRITRLMEYHRRRIRENGIIESSKEKLKQLQKQQQKTPSNLERTEKFKRLRYCRYADDFIFGVIGSFADAQIILEKISTFLQSDLLFEVSTNKTGIKRATRGIEFLGHNVKIISRDKIIKMKINGTHCKRRTISKMIRLSVPKRKIQDFCNEHGYGDLDIFKAKHIPRLVSSTEIDIVSSYNAELRGFANYYVLAKNVKKDLSLLQYIAHRSLVKTLANKHKTSTAKILKRLKRGDEFVLKYKVGDKRHEAKVFRLKHLNMTPNGNDVIILTHHHYKSGVELTKRMMAKTCEYCNVTNTPVEVHHVKKLKDLRKKPHLEEWERRMIARQRKTLILCKKCHQLLHQGKLPDNRKILKR